MNLDDLRREIDSVNHEILELLAKRVSLSKKVAQAKKENNLPIYDPIREKKQMAHILEMAAQLGLSTFVVEEVFRMIVEYSKIVMQLETSDDARVV